MLFDAIVSGRSGHGWEGFYFGENGEHSLYQISRAIGDALVAFGISKDPEPTAFTAEELAEYFGAESVSRYYSGSNSRLKGDRGRAIGWKPKYTTEYLLRSIRPKVGAFVQLQQGHKA